jgi:hypothetical protein
MSNKEAWQVGMVTREASVGGCSGQYESRLRHERHLVLNPRCILYHYDEGRDAIGRIWWWWMRKRRHWQDMVVVDAGRTLEELSEEGLS